MKITNMAEETNTPYSLVTTEYLVKAYNYAKSQLPVTADKRDIFEKFCDVIGVGTNYGYQEYNSTTGKWETKGTSSTSPHIYLAVDQYVKKTSTAASDDTTNEAVVTTSKDCAIWTIHKDTDFVNIYNIDTSSNDMANADDYAINRGTRSESDYARLSERPANCRYITLRIYADDAIAKLGNPYAIGAYSITLGLDTGAAGTYDFIAGDTCQASDDADFATVLGSRHVQVINSDHNTVAGSCNVTVAASNTTNERSSDLTEYGHNTVLGVSNASILDSSGIVLVHGTSAPDEFRGAAIYGSNGAIVFNEPECNIHGTKGGIYQTTGRVENSADSIVMDNSGETVSIMKDISTTVVLSGKSPTGGLDLDDVKGSVIVGQEGGSVSNVSNSVIIGTNGDIGKANEYVSADVGITNSILSLDNPNTSIPRMKNSVFVGNGSAASTANLIYNSIVSSTNDLGKPLSGPEMVVLNLDNAETTPVTGSVKTSAFASDGTVVYPGNVKYANLAFGDSELNAWSPTSFMTRADNGSGGDFKEDYNTTSGIVGAGYGNKIDFGIQNVFLAGNNNSIHSGTTNVGIIGSGNFTSSIKNIYSVKELSEVMSDSAMSNMDVPMNWILSHINNLGRGTVAVVSNGTSRNSVLTLNSYTGRKTNGVMSWSRDQALSLTVPTDDDNLGWDTVVGIYCNVTVRYGNDGTPDYIKWTWAADEQIGQDSGSTMYIPMMIGDNALNNKSKYYTISKSRRYKNEALGIEDANRTMYDRVLELRHQYTNASKLKNMVAVGDSNETYSGSTNSILIGDRAACHSMKLNSSVLANCGENTANHQESLYIGTLDNVIWYGHQVFAKGLADTETRHLHDSLHYIDTTMDDGVLTVRDGISDMFVFTGRHEYSPEWFNMPSAVRNWSQTVAKPYKDGSVTKEALVTYDVLFDGRTDINAPMLYTGGIALSAPDETDYGLIKLGSKLGVDSVPAGVLTNVSVSPASAAASEDIKLNDTNEWNAVLADSLKGLPIVSYGRYSNDGTQKVKFGKLTNENAYDRDTMLKVLGMTVEEAENTTYHIADVTYTSGAFVTVGDITAQDSKIRLKYSTSKFDSANSDSRFDGAPVTFYASSADTFEMRYAAEVTTSDIDAWFTEFGI